MVARTFSRPRWWLCKIDSRKTRCDRCANPRTIQWIIFAMERSRLGSRYCRLFVSSGAVSCREPIYFVPHRFVRRQVLGLTMYEEGDHSMYRNTLVAAAASGDKDTWDAALADLEKREVEVSPPHMKPRGGSGEWCVDFRLFSVGRLARYCA